MRGGRGARREKSRFVKPGDFYNTAAEQEGVDDRYKSCVQSDLQRHFN
jgi:hypothetical protein